MSAYEDLARDLQQAVDDGLLHFAAFRPSVESGAKLGDYGLIVADFVRMGRDAAGARRGLAETIWKRDRESSTTKISAVMPGGSYPLGTEPNLRDVTPAWYPMPYAGRCDICGALFVVGWGLVALVPGPTFEGVVFCEALLSCGRHSGSLVETRVDRERSLFEASIFKADADVWHS